MSSKVQNLYIYNILQCFFVPFKGWLYMSIMVQLFVIVIRAVKLFLIGQNIDLLLHVRPFSLSISILCLIPLTILDTYTIYVEVN